jgi:hypothetical protein
MQLALIMPFSQDTVITKQCCSNKGLGGQLSSSSFEARMLDFTIGSPPLIIVLITCSTQGSSFQLPHHTKKFHARGCSVLMYIIYMPEGASGASFRVVL